MPRVLGHGKRTSTWMWQKLDSWRIWEKLGDFPVRATMLHSICSWVQCYTPWVLGYNVPKYGHTVYHPSNDCVLIGCLVAAVCYRLKGLVPYQSYIWWLFMCCIVFRAMFSRLWCGVWLKVIREKYWWLEDNMERVIWKFRFWIIGQSMILSYLLLSGGNGFYVTKAVLHQIHYTWS